MNNEPEARPGIPQGRQAALPPNPDAIRYEQSLLNVIFHKNEVILGLMGEIDRVRTVSTRTQEQVARLKMELEEIRDKCECKASPGPSRMESNDGS